MKKEISDFEYIKRALIKQGEKELRELERQERLEQQKTESVKSKKLVYFNKPYGRK